MDVPANQPRVDEPEDLGQRTRQFGELFHENHRDVFNFIYSLVQNHADAEDVFQQTALVLWKRFDDFVVGTNFGAWATRVAHLTARDFLRSKRRSVPSFSDELLESIASSYRPQGLKSNIMRLEALSQCMEKLPRRDRKLVERCYAREAGFAEIAEDEGRSIAAIYQAICRARKSLYRCVERTLATENR